MKSTAGPAESPEEGGSFEKERECQARSRKKKILKSVGVPKRLQRKEEQNRKGSKA